MLRKRVTWSVTIAVLTLLMCLGSFSAYATSFYDVPDDFWAAPYITNLESRGIISGYGDGTFLPQNYVARCEYAKMLVNASGLKLSTKRTSPYADVDVNDWSFPYINSITQQMPGYQSTSPGDSRLYFKPWDNATREDVTVALMKVMNYDLSEYYPVDDSLLSDVFYDYNTIPKQDRPYIAEAVKQGYITGTQEGTFQGGDPIIRCEVAAILYRAFPNDNTAYVDSVNNNNEELPSDVALGNSFVKVYYLNIGQGDSEFVLLPNGKTMLIDASTSKYGKEICSFIKNVGYNKIDYLVATHPHADHIGGLNEVLNNFEIGTLYMTNAVTTTKTYEQFLSTIIEKNINVVEAKSGVTIFNEDTMSAFILAPSNNEYKDLNNYSAVIRIAFGNTAFLFMGDAEIESENEILSNYNIESLWANVIKIGHHGSSSSSQQAFLSKVNPMFAVISCGADNKYGHPTEQTLNTLNNMGIKTFRTDTDGTIIFASDGNNVYREY